MRVVQSNGMGVESTAILLRWLHDPSSRDFELSELTVLTAMVGDEFQETGDLMEQHVLPLLREHGVRYVQVARGGRSDRDGVVVLDDSRAPSMVHLSGGGWSLMDELTLAGTVPQFRSGARKCSLKFKGWPLDKWIAAELDGAPFRHVMGFNTDELRRVERDRSYSGVARTSEYPLVEWGWDRAACEAYILRMTGVAWPKSCCVFCPFAASKAGLPVHLERLRRYPEYVAMTIVMERVSTALNPRQTLFKSTSFESVVAAAGGFDAALAAVEDQLDEADWAVYRVRRVFTGVCHATRKVEVLWRGARSDASAALRRHARGGQVVTEAGSERVWTHRKGEQFPCVEEQLVAAPAAAEEKAGSKGFEDKWQRHLPMVAA